MWERGLSDRSKMGGEMGEVSFTTTMAATTKDIGKTTECMAKVASTIQMAVSPMTATGTWITSTAKEKSTMTAADVPPSPSTTRYSLMSTYSSVGKSTKVIFSMNKNMVRAS